MPVPQPPIRWRGAHPNNFTVGRPGGSRNGQKTDHHIVGTRESAVVVFNNPKRGASAHFVIGPDFIDQCVNINDTAWSDGNWASNLRTISIEHQGGLPTVPYEEQMYEKAAWLTAWLRENYGVTHHVDHRQIKSTQCPGGLDTNRIWARSDQIIAEYNKPPAQPEWMKNREPFEATIYAQIEGLRLVNLNNPNQFADSRVFPRNTSFEIGSKTTVTGVVYLITKSSTAANIPNGIRANEVATQPWTPPPPPAPEPPPPPPAPETPDWKDSLIDEDNRSMYVIRETHLIDLENGRPVVGADGKEIVFRAGDVIKDVSAHTIVGGITYYLTEYSFSKLIARGIKANDLSLDPQSTPPGTPANPIDTGSLIKLLQYIVSAINLIIDKLRGKG